MENQVKTLEQRFKDHIKNYNLSSLYEMNEVRNYLKNLATVPICRRRRDTTRS